MTKGHSAPMVPAGEDASNNPPGSEEHWEDALVVCPGRGSEVTAYERPFSPTGLLPCWHRPKPVADPGGLQPCRCDLSQSRHPCREWRPALQPIVHPFHRVRGTECAFQSGASHARSPGHPRPEHSSQAATCPCTTCSRAAPVPPTRGVLCAEPSNCTKIRGEQVLTGTRVSPLHKSTVAKSTTWKAPH